MALVAVIAAYHNRGIYQANSTTGSKFIPKSNTFCLPVPFWSERLQTSLGLKGSTAHCVLRLHL